MKTRINNVSTALLKSFIVKEKIMKKLMLTSAIIGMTAFGVTACSNTNTGTMDHHSTMPHSDTQHQGMHAMQHSPAMMNHAMSQLNLTEQQKAEIHALHQNKRLRGHHMDGEIMNILTPEQQEQLKNMHLGHDAN